MPPDFCMTSLCFPSIPFIPGCLWTGLCVCRQKDCLEGADVEMEQT